MITPSDPPAQKKTIATAPFQKLEKPSSKDGALVGEMPQAPGILSTLKKHLA